MPDRESVIEASHSRSAQFGLERHYEADFHRPPPGQWRGILERNELLRRNAAPIMETLHDEIANSHSMVVLTDDIGLILHTLGDSEFLSKAEKVALTPGIDWSEKAKGTNAIGTAIFDKRPTLVHANEHFLESNHFLTCSATPIFGPTGQLAGVLDVTGDQRSFHQHTMALVRLSATMIENKLVLSSAQCGFRVRFHKRAESIQTLAEGIVIFDADGLLVSANRVARTQFGIDGELRHRCSFEEVFGSSLGRVLIVAKEDQQVPVALCVNGEVAVYGIVEPLKGAMLGFPRSGRGSQPMDEFAPVAGSRSPESRQPPEAIAPPRRVNLPSNEDLDRLDTGDLRIRDVLDRVRKLANRQLPTLILGETGSGKELLARALHRASPRCNGPFIAVNCAAIPETLIESELFGYAEGAFTGAKRRGYTGRIQQAHGGTLFLDEIGDMPLSLQARLLRVLQERSVSPLGSARNESVDFMLVSATHRDLDELIRSHLFRQDLLYRLNTLTVRLPALRDRSDLAPLVDLILRQQCQWPLGIAPRLLAAFASHPWPGNVRELSNLLQTMVALAEGSRPLDITDLPDPEGFLAPLGHGNRTSAAPAASVARAEFPLVSPGAPGVSAPAHPMELEDIAMAAIEQALRQHSGNVSAAAKALGISRNTVYRRLQRASAVLKV